MMPLVVQLVYIVIMQVDFRIAMLTWSWMMFCFDLIVFVVGGGIVFWKWCSRAFCF